MIEFGELFPAHRGWTPGDRYVWLRTVRRAEEREPRYLEVFDTERRETVRRITLEDLDGMLPANVNASPHSEDVLIFSYRKPGREITDRRWWLADADGTNLRETDIKDDDRVWGWTHDGDLVIWTDKGVERLDPDTMQRRVIRDLPRPPRETESR